MRHEGDETFYFASKKEEDETWADYFSRTASVARKIWTKMKLLFLSDVIAESMWRGYATGMRQEINCGYRFLEASVRVEKHEMVADHKSD